MRVSVVARALDLGPLNERYRNHAAEVSGALPVQLIAGELSNVTLFLRGVKGRRWVVRRPSQSSVLNSVYDVTREYSLQSVLSGTAIPGSCAIGQERDDDDFDNEEQRRLPRVTRGLIAHGECLLGQDQP